MDNFIDVSHFPFVHDGGLGDRNHAQIEDFEVKVDKDGITIGNLQLRVTKKLKLVIGTVHQETSVIG